jgi:type II secretory pathway component PulK
MQHQGDLKQTQGIQKEKEDRMNKPPRHAGAALLLVLWAIAVVSFAVLWMSGLVNLELQAANSSSAGLRARQIALSGVAIGLHPRTKPQDQKLLNQELEGGDRMEVNILGEGARLNINRLLADQDRITLKNLFILWGLSNDEADQLIDKLIDWTDVDEFRLLNGAERAEYLTLGISDAPANQPFRSVAEMSRVIGMDRLAQANPAWTDTFTIFGDGKVDVNEAGAEVLQAATGLTAEMVGEILRIRIGSDGVERTDDDFVFESTDQLRGWLQVSALPLEQVMSRLTTESPVKRIDSRGMVGDRTVQISVVAATVEGGAANTYLLWEEK